MKAFKSRYFDIIKTINVEQLNIKSGQYELTVTQDMDGKRFNYVDRSTLTVANIGGQPRITKVVMDVTKHEVAKNPS